MSECAYCGREALSKDRNCYGCGAPVRRTKAYRAVNDWIAYTGQARVGTDLCCTMAAPVGTHLRTIDSDNG